MQPFPACHAIPFLPSPYFAFFRISNSENPTKKPTFAGNLPSWKDKNKTNQTKDNSL